MTNFNQIWGIASLWEGEPFNSHEGDNDFFSLNVMAEAL